MKGIENRKRPFPLKEKQTFLTAVVIAWLRCGCKHLGRLLALSCGRDGQDTTKQWIRLWVTSRLTWALVRCWPAYFECFYQLKDNLTDWKIHQPNVSYSGNNNRLHTNMKGKKEKRHQSTTASSQRCVQMHASKMQTTKQKCFGDPLEMLEFNAIAASGFHLWFPWCFWNITASLWPWCFSGEGSCCSRLPPCLNAQIL